MFRKVDSLILVYSDHLRFIIFILHHLSLAQKIDDAGYPLVLQILNVTFAVWIRPHVQILVDFISFELIPKTTIDNL